MNVLRYSTRKNNTVLDFIVRFFADCPIYSCLPFRQVLRVNSLATLAPPALVSFGIKSVNAIPFLREVGVIRVNVSNETTCVRQPLRFSQVALASC